MHLLGFADYCCEVINHRKVHKCLILAKHSSNTVTCTLSVPDPIVITCSDLPSLTNGIIIYGGAGSNNSRPVDTVAIYTCEAGYTLTDVSTRTCGSDGVWNGFASNCWRKSGMDFVMFVC